MRLSGLMILMCLLQGCITTENDGFVNYKAVGDVFGTKPQTVDYEEIGVMTTSNRDFFWASCDSVCKGAVEELKYMSKDRGGDSLIDVSYSSDHGKTKTPTCEKQWWWAWFYVLPVMGPWVQKCEVEGIAVARAKQKEQQNAVGKSSGTPSININNNVNNNQINGGQKGEQAKPSH